MADDNGGGDDETVCSFCGMSHLMYAEQLKSERVIATKAERITLLETHMTKLGIVVPPTPEVSEVSDSEQGYEEESGSDDPEQQAQESGAK